ncbi:MAG: hypothetical protein NTW29_19825 [Bacteroidetes bacterium]|nr:hypothetical protein [Bacteroidota bacterium]
MRSLLIKTLLNQLTASCATKHKKSVPTNSKFDTLPIPADSSTFYFDTKNSGAFRKIGEYMFSISQIRNEITVKNNGDY